jgi:hypothetical protein
MSEPPPPYLTIAIRYIAGAKGVVNFEEILPAPNGSVALQVNLKITQPAEGEDGKADLVILGTNSPVEDMIYDRGNHQRMFNDTNASTSSPVLGGNYTNGCPCVYPLDLTCPNDDDVQEPFDIESPVKGNGFRIRGTLASYAYHEGDTVEGIMVVVLAP